MESFKDNENTAYYNYDASGERNFKLTGDIIELTQNGVPYNYAFLESPTLYASGLITINERGYTKHYFEENKRVCSNLGGGFRYAGYDIMDSIELITPFLEQWRNAKDGIFKTFEQCIKSPVDLENTQEKIVKVMKNHEKNRNEEEYQFYYTNDHLGSSTYITNKEGQITQTLAYLPYGEDWVDLDNHPPYLTPYKFNGKEKDPETGYNYFGARYYTDWASIWLSVDPMSDKYPHLTSYNYCANNPVMLIDPDGREGVVVSGGEYDGNRYKYNFIEPAITRLKQLKSEGGDKSITWAVMTAAYSDEDIAKFQSIATELGVGFQKIGSADELTNYLNSKNIGTSILSDTRKGDKITSLTVFGHGYVGSAEFAHGQGPANQIDFSWGIDKINKLDKGAFNNAVINLYTCNSATRDQGGQSFGYELAKQSGSTVFGYRGQSTYTEMNKGEGMNAKWNRFSNGFNTKGSLRLPQGGKGAKLIKYIQP